VSSLLSPRPFRLIALDIDGTLLDDRGEVSAANADALKRFVDSGGLVVLASGRMTDNIRPFYTLMGIDGPTIGYNGALARDSVDGGFGVILETPLPARYGDYLIDYAERQRFLLNYYMGEKLYAQDDPSLRRFADLYSRQTGARYHFVPDLRRFRGCRPTKLIIVTDPTDANNPNPRHRDELYEMWTERWGSEVTVMRTNPEYLEFYHRDASKGRALGAVANRYRIDRSLTLAFGDNYNDVSLLQSAGLGVAVANANADAKAAAGWVSPLSNNENAIADSIDRFVEGS